MTRPGSRILDSNVLIHSVYSNYTIYIHVIRDVSIVTGHHHHGLLTRDPLAHVLLVLPPVHKSINILLLILN